MNTTRVCILHLLTALLVIVMCAVSVQGRFTQQRPHYAGENQHHSTADIPRSAPFSVPAASQASQPEEINGTITFGVSWDGHGDIVKHEIWADTGDGAEDVSNMLLRDGTFNVSHVKTKVRIKRKAQGGEDYVRHGPVCFQRHLDIMVDDTPKEGKLRMGKSVHVALMVSEQEEVQMTCHYCDNEDEEGNKNEKKDKDKARKSMLWYKISRTHQGYREFYKVKEVRLDMHDDDKRNRVFVTDTHTLVIRKVKRTDGGSYFCRDMTKEDPFFKARLTAAEIAIMFEADDKLRFMYHVDVVAAKADKWKRKMVTTNKDLKSKVPMATADVKVWDYNVEIFTSWEEWSRCSSCDQPGTRRRLGICMVRKIDKAKKSVPWYVNVMLDIYTQGMLCRSTVFSKHKEIKLKAFRPVDEVEEAVCNVTCTNYTMSITDMVISDSGDIGIEVFVLKEGESVALACPNAPPDMPVAWINGTRVLIRPYLKSQSDGRLSIDENNTFHISRLEVSDAAHYICIVGGRIAGRVMLGVEPIPPEAIVWLYAYYLLCSYPIDFAVFILLLCVRHVQRKKVLNYDILPDLEDDSTASGSSASDINVNRNANADSRRKTFPASLATLVETVQPGSSTRLVSAGSPSILD